MKKILVILLLFTQVAHAQIVKNAAYQIDSLYSSLIPVSDTTNYKPVVIGVDNKYRKFSYWPVGSGVTQIQSDWNQANTSALDYIKNKPTIPTNNNQLTNGSNYITAASPALTGTPTAPTPTAGDNSTKIATTAWVLANVSSTTSEGVTTSTASTYTVTGTEQNIIIAYSGGGATITMPSSPADRTVLYISNMSVGTSSVSVPLWSTPSVSVSNIQASHWVKIVYKATDSKWYLIASGSN